MQRTEYLEGVACCLPSIRKFYDYKRAANTIIADGGELLAGCHLDDLCPIERQQCAVRGCADRGRVDEIANAAR